MNLQPSTFNFQRFIVLAVLVLACCSAPAAHAQGGVLLRAKPTTNNIAVNAISNYIAIELPMLGTNSTQLISIADLVTNTFAALGVGTGGGGGQTGTAALTNFTASLTNKIFLNGASNIVVAISNAPNNSVIYLSADTWNVTPSKVLSNSLGGINLFNKSNIVIEGIPGLSIISGRAAVGELLYMTNCENIVIRGVTFDGLVVTNYTLLSGIGHVWGSVGIYNVRGLRFEGNSVINAHDHGIYDLGSQPNWNTISTNRVEILRNWFHNVGSQRTNEATAYDGTAIVPTGWTIDGNTFTECLRCIEPYTENDASPNLEYRDVIRNNVAFNTLEFFLGPAGSTNTHFLTAENNTMINDWDFTRRGTNIFDSSAAIAWNGGYGWKIKNNSIKGRWGYGIIASSGVRDGLIAWNHIYDLTNGGSAVPIQAGVTYRTDIIGNDIRRSENQGIYLFGFRDGLVADNRIIDTAAGLGIRLLTSGGTVTSNATLRGNYIKVATVGIQDLSGGLENISLVDNIIEEASTKVSNSSGAEVDIWNRDGDTNSFARIRDLNTASNALYTAIGSGGGGGTNYPPVISITTNVTVGTGVRQSVTMLSASNQFLNFQGTALNGEEIEVAVTNTAATNISISLNASGSATTFYDPTVTTNVSSFGVAPGQKIVTFKYSTNNGARWRLNSYLGREPELVAGYGAEFGTNSAGSIITNGVSSVLRGLHANAASTVTNENSGALEINSGVLTLTPGALSNIVASGHGAPYIAVNTNSGTLANVTNLIFRSGAVVSNDAAGIASLHITAAGGAADGAGTTNELWLNLKDFGAVADGVTDNTTALSNAVYTAMGGSKTNFATFATIFAPAGVYAFTTSPWTGGTGTADSTNLVISIPHKVTQTIGGDYSLWSKLRFKGESQPAVWAGSSTSTPTPTNGTVFLINNTNTGAFIKSAGPTTHGTYNFTTIQFQEMTFQVKTNNRMRVLDLTHFVDASIWDCSFVNEAGSGGITMPIDGSTAVEMPEYDAGDLQSLYRVNIEGFARGLVIGEHTRGDEINIVGCRAGLVLKTSNFENLFGRVKIAACATNIYGEAGSYLKILSYNGERTGTDWRTNYWDFADFGAGGIIGEISGTVKDNNNSLNSNKLRISGGANMVFKIATEPHGIISTGTGAAWTRGSHSTRYSADAIGPWYSFRKGRGTMTTPAVPSSGDTLGLIGFWAYDGSTWYNSAYMGALTSGSTSAGNSPTRLAFATGTTSPIETLSIASGQTVGVGATSPLAKMHVTNSTASQVAFRVNQVATSDIAAFYTGNTLVGALGTNGVLSTSGGLKMGTGTGPTISFGTGTPEAAVTAEVGSLFLRTDGGASTTLYVKESGTGNTGWIAK